MSALRVILEVDANFSKTTEIKGGRQTKNPGMGQSILLISKLTEEKAKRKQMLVASSLPFLQPLQGFFERPAVPQLCHRCDIPDVHSVSKAAVLVCTRAFQPQSPQHKASAPLVSSVLL